MITRHLFHSIYKMVAATCLLMAITTVHAHLMVAQHGTVNFANGGAFLVLSVPVSAFKGVDDDDDGALSVKELRRHTSEIERQIHAGVQLLDESGKLLPLQGLLLSLTHPDHNAIAPAGQLVALGRFPVTDAMSSPVLRITLQGESPQEQEFSVTATRNRQSDVMVFAPDRESHTVFAKERLVEQGAAINTVSR